MKFPVALQVYSVRDFAEKDLEGTFRQIKEMGYDGVELAGLYGYSYAEVKAAAEKAGLTPISAHVPLADMLADSDVGASKGGLFDDSRTLSKLIGRPTTPLAESVKAIL